MLRIPHFLENQLTEVGEFVGFTFQLQHHTPEILFFFFWYTFLLEAE
jgi:hypothetical protein